MGSINIHLEPARIKWFPNNLHQPLSHRSSITSRGRAILLNEIGLLHRRNKEVTAKLGLLGKDQRIPIPPKLIDRDPKEELPIQLNPPHRFLSHIPIQPRASTKAKEPTQVIQVHHRLPKGLNFVTVPQHMKQCFWTSLASRTQIVIRHMALEPLLIGEQPSMSQLPQHRTIAVRPLPAPHFLKQGINSCNLFV